MLSSEKHPSRNEDMDVSCFHDQALLRDEVPLRQDRGLFWTCVSGQRTATCHCRGAGWVEEVPMVVKLYGPEEITLG